MLLGINITNQTVKFTQTQRVQKKNECDEVLAVWCTSSACGSCLAADLGLGLMAPA